MPRGKDNWISSALGVRLGIYRREIQTHNGFDTLFALDSDVIVSCINPSQDTKYAPHFLTSFWESVNKNADKDVNKNRKQQINKTLVDRIATHIIFGGEHSAPALILPGHFEEVDNYRVKLVKLSAQEVDRGIKKMQISLDDQSLSDLKGKLEALPKPQTDSEMQLALQELNELVPEHLRIFLGFGTKQLALSRLRRIVVANRIRGLSKDFADKLLPLLQNEDNYPQFRLWLEQLEKSKKRFNRSDLANRRDARALFVLQALNELLKPKGHRLILVTGSHALFEAAKGVSSGWDGILSNDKFISEPDDDFADSYLSQFQDWVDLALPLTEKQMASENLPWSAQIDRGYQKKMSFAIDALLTLDPLPLRLSSEKSISGKSKALLTVTEARGALEKRRAEFAKLPEDLKTNLLLSAEKGKNSVVELLVASTIYRANEPGIVYSEARQAVLDWLVTIDSPSQGKPKNDLLVRQLEKFLVNKITGVLNNASDMGIPLNASSSLEKETQRHPPYLWLNNQSKANTIQLRSPENFVASLGNDDLKHNLLNEETSSYSLLLLYARAYAWLNCWQISLALCQVACNLVRYLGDSPMATMKTPPRGITTGSKKPQHIKNGKITGREAHYFCGIAYKNAAFGAENRLEYLTSAKNALKASIRLARDDPSLTDLGRKFHAFRCDSQLTSIDFASWLATQAVFKKSSVNINSQGAEDIIVLLEENRLQCASLRAEIKHASQLALSVFYDADREGETNAMKVIELIFASTARQIRVNFLCVCLLVPELFNLRHDIVRQITSELVDEIGNQDGFPRFPLYSQFIIGCSANWLGMKTTISELSVLLDNGDKLKSKDFTGYDEWRVDLIRKNLEQNSPNLRK